MLTNQNHFLLKFCVEINTVACRTDNFHLSKQAKFKMSMIVYVIRGYNLFINSMMFINLHLLKLRSINMQIRTEKAITSSNNHITEICAKMQINIFVSIPQRNESRLVFLTYVSLFQTYLLLYLLYRTAVVQVTPNLHLPMDSHPNSR